jgi:hypothetical protein
LRFDFTLEQVTEAYVEVFWEVSKFKTSNNNLHLETRRKYGTTKPSKNELMSWVVKGYIAEVKGFEINWAKAIVCTTREKTRREPTEKMMKLQISKVSGNEISCKSKGDALWKGKIYKTWYWRCMMSIWCLTNGFEQS